MEKSKIALLTTILIFITLGFFLLVRYAASPAYPREKLGEVLTFPEYISPALSDFPKKLKVITFNMGYASGKKNNLPLPLTSSEVENHLDQIAKALEEIDADIICLQEVDFHSARSFKIDQMRYLVHRLKIPYAAFRITWDKNYVPWPYTHHFKKILSGQAVLSRFPIDSQEFFVFPKPASNPFWYNLFYLDRVAQKVKLTLGNHVLTVWNIHLEAFDPHSRLSQSTTLSEQVNLEKTPQIVMGDFNSVSASKKELEDQHKKELEDNGESVQEFSKATGFKNAESDPTVFTMPSWDPIKKIDHIFYSREHFQFLETGTAPGLLASDHLPLWATLTFSEEKK